MPFVPVPVSSPRADATAIVAPARAAHDIALAEATRELEIAQIEARIALDVALTDAEVADWVASTAAAVDRVVDEQDTYVALAALVGARGVRQARAAAGEDQPDDTPPDLDPGLAADETWDPDEMEDYATGTDHTADPDSIHFCSMTQEDDGPKLEIPDGTGYIARTWWYSETDRTLYINDRYYGSHDATTYIAHSACYGFPLDEKPPITYGQMGFKLVAIAWVPWKALDTDHEAPMPKLNGMCSPEARENYNRIGSEMIEMGEDFAWHSLEVAMWFLPGPEDLAFAAFWKYAGERGFTCLVVNGRQLLFKAGKLLTGKELEEAVGTLKRWSTKLGHSGNRVAPDVAEAIADSSEAALKKAGKVGALANAPDAAIRKAANSISSGTTGSHARRLSEDLIKRGYPRPPAYQAGHIVPTGQFINRSTDVQKAITVAQEKFNKYLGADLRDAAVNGFWAEAGHAGTHKDKFFLELGKAFQRVKDRESAERALESIWRRIDAGEFQ